MQLTLVNAISSPFGRKPDIIWTLEQQGVFLLSDRWNMVRLNADCSAESLWQTTDKETARQLEDVYDDRLANPYYNGLREAGHLGFKLLDKAAYDQIFGEVPLINRRLPLIAHDGAIVDLLERTISLLQIEGDRIVELAKTKTKGKAKTAAMLHPEKNLIVYGTNYGELYAQPFEPGKFGKTTKVDQLPNACYQIAFGANGTKMFVVGLGYLRVYDFRDGIFKISSSQMTAARSFLIIDDHLILNKGLHGIDVIHIAGKPERVFFLDLPFSIDRMAYLATQKTFLLTSGHSEDLYLLKWGE